MSENQNLRSNDRACKGRRYQEFKDQALGRKGNARSHLKPGERGSLDGKQIFEFIHYFTHWRYLSVLVRFPRYTFFTRFSFVGNESVSHISDPMNSVNYGNIGDASGSQMETQQSNALPSSVQSKQQRNPVSVLSTQVSEVVIDDFLLH